MRTPTINKEELIQALRKLCVEGDISYREMERKSGVYNVSRIVSGEIKKPTAESWQLLHEAYPMDIPEPSYIGGDRIYKNITADNNSSAAGKSIFNMQQGVSLSASEQALIDGLRKLGEKKDEFIYEVLGMISKMLKNQ
jgi:transcriptional regulator with XRE-family HTH domain